MKSFKQHLNESEIPSKDGKYVHTWVRNIVGHRNSGMGRIQTSYYAVTGKTAEGKYVDISKHDYIEDAKKAHRKII